VVAAPAGVLAIVAVRSAAEAAKESHAARLRICAS
jgi:hypothetical protein